MKTQAQIELEFSRRIELEIKARIAKVDPTYDSSQPLVEDIKKWLKEEMNTSVND